MSPREMQIEVERRL
jgi:hypothetical protein